MTTHLRDLYDHAVDLGDDDTADALALLVAQVEDGSLTETDALASIAL